MASTKPEIKAQLMMSGDTLITIAQAEDQPAPVKIKLSPAKALQLGEFLVCLGKDGRSAQGRIRHGN